MAPSYNDTLTPRFFRLPSEIRLEIYSLAFGHGKAIIEAKIEDNSCSLVPQVGTFQNHTARSSQLLRVSRTILFEARPVFYANTVFHVIDQAFAENCQHVSAMDVHPISNI